METFTEKNLAGTLNMAVPGDALSAGECISLKNWRPEQRSILQSRLREDLIQSGFADPIVGIFETGDPQQLYVADAVGIYGIVGGVKHTLASNPHGRFTDFVNFQGYTWIMNPDVQLRSADGITAEPWIQAAPSSTLTVAAGSSGALNGTYLYSYSSVTTDGIESNLAPTATVTVTNQYVNVSGIPVDSNPAIAAHWIYRAGGTQAAANPLRVGVVTNGTTTFTDNLSDAAATELDIEHTQDHDPPPAGSGLVGPDNYGHLYAWLGNRLFWSESDTPWYWPGVQLVAGNYTDVGADDELIQRVTIKPRITLIYKQGSIWKIVGDIDTQFAVQEPIGVKRGLQSPRGICSDGTTDYFASDDGVYSCDADRITPLTRGFDQTLWENGNFPTTLPLGSFFPVAFSGALRQSQLVMEICQQNVFFSYPDQASFQLDPTTQNQKTLVLNIETKRWSVDSRGWSALYNSHAQSGASFFYGGAAGSLYNITGNVSAALDLDYTSRYYDFDKPRNQKTFVDLEVEFHMDDTTENIQVVAWFNNGASSFTLGTINGPGSTPTTGPSGEIVFYEKRITKQLPFPDETQAYNIALQLVGTGITGITMAYGFHFRYRLEQRDANTYDSNVSELGAAGMWKQVEAFAVDIDQASGTSNWTLYSDFSGSSQVVATGTLPSTSSTRATLKVPLAQNAQNPNQLVNGCAEGRLFRLVITSSAATIRVYSAQLFMRVIGTYLATQETLALLPQNFGKSRLKMFKRVDIDCEGGEYTLGVSTDLPGGLLSSRIGFSQQPHPRRVDKMYLPQNTRGIFLQPVVIATTGALKIYSARVWVKAIGEAGASSWEWADLPILPTRETFEWVALEVDS